MASKTPLFDAHLALNGRMVEFAGYELPVQYEKGIIAEHNAVRNNCGIFDVSHMGEIFIEGENAENAVNYLISNDIFGMENFSCRYTLMLNEEGGVVDDFIVYRFNERKYMLVVNASNRQKDFDWIKAHLLSGAKAADLSDNFGQVALQGPKAEKALSRLTDNFPKSHYTFLENAEIAGSKCIISRTSYTGEDGFEIYIHAADTQKVYLALLEKGKEEGLIPCGLGCRDTLRFEAGLPLYGHELNENFLATELGLNIFIKKDKEDFVGKKAIVEKPPQFKKKGAELIDRGIARESYPVLDGAGASIGFVTTGTMSPTLNKAIALVRINKDYADDFCYVDCKGRILKARFVKTPFYRREN